MRKRRWTAVGLIAALYWMLSACSSSQLNPEEQMQMFLDNMLNSSYDFTGKLDAQVGQNEKEELLVLHGVYVGQEGYRMDANVHLPGFNSGTGIMGKDDQLYYKLPESDKWKPTSEQDLRMLGITYKDSPSEMFQGMKDVVLSVKPTDRQNVYRLTLDRHKFTGQENQKNRMKLPQVDVQTHDLQLKLLDNPVVDVEVDLEEQTIRSVVLNYEVESNIVDGSPKPIKMTYTMDMANFNGGQTLPQL